MLRKQAFARCLFVALVGLGCGQMAIASVSWSGTGPGPLAFETAANWTGTTYTPTPVVGNEGTPPAKDSHAQIDSYDGVVTLTSERTGQNGTQPLGALSIGLGNANQVSELDISASVTFTGIERTTSIGPGEYNATLRHVRVGRDDTTPTDTNYPWGIVKQTAGSVTLAEDVTTVADPDGAGPAVGIVAQPGRAELLLSSDKDSSAGSIWEVGGTASLKVPDELRVGNRVQTGTMPGSIFRVRGSQVGQVLVGTGVGDTAGYLQTYRAFSRGSLWNMDQPGGDYGTATRTNLGKSVTEFVLDSGGVTPITVGDRIELAGMDNVPAVNTNPGVTGTAQRELAFLRIKLQEPTTAGTGASNLVLFKADRIAVVTTAPWVASGTDYDLGRFFDPDRDGQNLSMTGLTPHRREWEGDTVTSDYAGATYTWQIHYCNQTGSVTCFDDNTVDNAVWLNNLVVTGVPGDLNHDNSVNVADRNALIAAIASPPKTHYQLLGAAQNLYDINADDVIDNNDLARFNALFLPGGTPGDFNGDGHVDARDYTLWRDNLGAASEAVINSNGDGANGVDANDFTVWKNHFGNPPGAGGGGFGGGTVPEPGSIVLALVGVVGLFGLRRRAR